MTTASPLRIILFGASGRMGRAVSKVVGSDDRTLLIGSVQRDGDRHVFLDASGKEKGIGLLSQADVAIDFSLPQAVDRHLNLCRDHGLRYVCGVTGLGADTQAALQVASTRIAALWAPNMSVGVTVCFAAAADIATRLGGGFSVTIHDIHHASKRDAPSGTALEFGRIIDEACGGDVTIAYSSVREGDHPGEHHIMFSAGTDEIELRHTAGSRDEFARGAVRAALWLADQNPGLYNMRNVLGITSSR